MVELLTDYLSEYGEVVLPGVGQLHITQTPSRYDAARQAMVSPSPAFAWQPDTAVAPARAPQALIGFLSRKANWTEEESYEQLQAFAATLTESLQAGGEWTWPGIGKLVAFPGNETAFVPDISFARYDTGIPVTRATHAGRAHHMRVGDTETTTVAMEQQLLEETETGTARWWLPALLVALATALLIGLRLAAIL